MSLLMPCDGEPSHSIISASSQGLKSVNDLRHSRYSIPDGGVINKTSQVCETCEV